MTEIEHNQVLVEFIIYGDNFDPDKVTDVLGVKPSQTGIKGQTIKRNPNLKYKDTFWQYDTGYQESDDTEEQIKEIYNVFKDKTRILKDIGQSYQAVFKVYIVIKMYKKEIPLISMEHWWIDFLHEIHAKVEFDNYVYL